MNRELSRRRTQAESDFRSCRRVLPAVSRTFALTIRVLPGSLRTPVTIAYLLCRLADQVEDATEIEPGRRIHTLESFAQVLGGSIRGPERLASSLDDLDQWPQTESGTGDLVRNRLTLFRAYGALPAAEREVISRWVQAMALGMSTYVARENRRPDDTSAVPFVLQTEEELRAYAYYVAGTVGHMLTELFTLHLGRRACSVARMRELAAPFGLGLQFTNILQDLAEDRRRGWSYIPEDLARRHGTSVSGLDQPESRPAALRVVGDVVREAAEYLDRAMEYTLLLPRGAPRLRLFCLWPIFFALRTLVRVWGEERVLTGGYKIRITRPEVRQIVGATSVACLWNGWLERLYGLERARLTHRIEIRPV
jgi:farnesyl-diphosphate farnesyltransferase